jgi:RNA polymerase sigma-54 factor
MRLDTSQQLRLSQEMKLSPRIIQAMEILQLPLMALQERIDAELVSNPVLELQENSDAQPEEPIGEDRYERGETQMVVDDDHGNAEDFRRLDDMTDEYGGEFANEDYMPPRRASGSVDAGDAKLEAMANTPAPEGSLSDYLHEQWSLMDIDETRRAIGHVLIDNIDEDGYLRADPATLSDKLAAEQLTADDETLESVIEAIQALEPTGVGARDLRECLLLQLRAEERSGHDVSKPRELVSQHLREIELNRLPAIAKRTGWSIETIKQAIEALSHLNPRPGLSIATQTAPVISPDVIVQLDENGQVVVTMADSHLPALMINDYYAEQARNRRTDRDTKQFLKKNIRSAQWIIEAIAQRRHTIRRVTEEIFKVQREFLDVGREALKPLPMAEVAEKVGVHVATVSRAVSDKYAQTPRGIYPLRMFFSGGTTTAEGQEMSWDAVKARLREIVDAEDKSNPLNDDQLAEALKRGGIDIARRTVAKYRNAMNIPSARQRKAY